MKLLYPILLMASFASTASDMTIAGLTFGSPVLTPECAKEKDAWGSVRYVTFSSTTCWSDMKLLGPGMVHASILFGSSGQPSIISWRAMEVYLRDGKLVAASFYTHGLPTQNYDLKTLIEKYGEPTAKTVLQVQNRLGAKFDSISATWALPDITVDFSGTFTSLDYGHVTIALPQGEELVQQRAKQLSDLLGRNKL